MHHSLPLVEGTIPKMVQFSSFLGFWPVRKGSFIISLLTLIIYIALFIIYIVIYNKKELDSGKYTAFDVWAILALIVHAIKILMGGLLLFSVQQEIPGLLMLWSFAFFGTSVVGAVFDIALIILWSWWMIIPVLIAILYIYFVMITFSYYKELSGTSFNT